MIKNIFCRILHTLAFYLPGGYNVRPFLHRMRGVKMGKNVWIAKSVYIDELHPDNVTVGDNSAINYRTTIYTHMYFGPRQKKYTGKVVIEKDVYVGPHCLILPNVTIGEGSVIKGGTVVTRNVPPHTLWGIPNAGPLAKVTVPLTPKNTYDDFVKGIKPIRGKKKPTQK